jgi:hypothetical protein
MQLLEISGAVRPIEGSLGVEGLMFVLMMILLSFSEEGLSVFPVVAAMPEM